MSTREVQGEVVGRGPEQRVLSLGSPERTEPRGVGMSRQGSGLGSGSASEPFQGATRGAACGATETRKQVNVN